MLSFFPRGVLDEILNLIESVSEEFPSYSCLKRYMKICEQKKSRSSIITKFHVEPPRAEETEYIQTIQVT